MKNSFVDKINLAIGAVIHACSCNFQFEWRVSNFSPVCLNRIVEAFKFFKTGDFGSSCGNDISTENDLSLVVFNWSRTLY